MKFRKWLRIAAWVVAAKLVLLALGFGLLQLAPLRVMLAAAIGGLASSGDTTVTVDGLDGWLPASPRIRRVTISDRAGPWLIMDGISADWSPLSLLFGNFVASDISVTSIDWLRNPEPGPASSTSGSPSIPALLIGHAGIRSIRIAAPVTGIASQLTFEGHGDLLDPSRRAILAASLREAGEGKAVITADVAWDPDGLGLRLKLNANDIAGGILTRLANLPPDTPLLVTGESRGTLDDWRALVTVDAGSKLKAITNVAIRREDSGHHMEAQVNADVGDIGPENLRKYIKGQATLTLDATRNNAGALRLDAVHLEALAGKLTASLEGTTAKAPLRLAAETGLLLPGGATISLRAEPDRAWFDSGVTLAITADANALGAKAKFQGALSRENVNGDFALEVPDARSIGLDGGSASLVAKASLARKTRSVSLDGKMTLTGQPAANGTFDVKVTGTLDTPAVNLKGNFAGQPLLLSAAVTKGSNEQLVLRDTKLSLGSATLAGDLAIEDSIARGSLAFRAGDMKDLSGLADLDMSGAASGTLDLLVNKGQQDARVTLASQRLRLDTVTLTSPKIAGRLLGPEGRLSFDLKAEAPNVDVDGFILDHVTASGKGPLSALDVDAIGLHQGATIMAKGRLKADHRPTRIALSSLTLTRDRHQARLAAPVELTIVHGAVEIPAARLLAGNGELRVKGTAGREMALALEPQALPLWVTGLVTDPLPVTGTLTGSVSMHGRAHDRLASFDVRLADIAAESARAAPRNLVLLAKGTTDRNAVTFKADLTGARGTTLHASGRVPFDGKAALAIEANGDADMSFANAWLSATGERATGRLSLSAKVTGTLQSPRVAGSGTIHDGFFRSPDAGLELRDIEARLEGSERRVVLSSLTAKAPNGGSVSASGDVILDHAAGYPVSVTVNARKAQLVATSLTTLTTAIDAKLTGALLKKPLVSGTVDIARWDIRVPERLARPLTPIPVTHTNVAPGFVVAGEAEDGTPDSAFTFALDLTVRAPREVFVRGQGIDAEFGGDARLTGTVEDPAVRGHFDLRRGSITLLSQRVSLSRGNVQFLGDLQPVLDIAGGVSKNSVTATVTVKGKASDPQIALSSVPSLPQDEILARLLFSKQTSQLSPFEAAELAQAVGKWSGLTSGPDILDRLRNAIGIDALSATTDDTGATAVNAGRYIGSGVFVGVSQASGGSATVDVDLSEDIKLRGEAGAKGTKVGVAAEWEY